MREIKTLKWNLNKDTWVSHVRLWVSSKERDRQSRGEVYVSKQRR